MTYENRKTIEMMLKEGICASNIADFMGYNRSTVYRELQRCEKGKYTADEAHKFSVYVHDNQGCE